MKKENRKLAQEKRAQERKQKEQSANTKKYLSIGLPIVIIAVIILFIYTNPFPSLTDAKDDAAHDHDHTTTEESADSTVTDDTTETSLQTDASLTVEDGDTVNIDYVGSVDGVEFSGGNTQGYGADLTIGSGMYIDDFEEQLIGAHPGDTVNVVVTFPENYGVDELNGKEAVFETVINGIYR